MFFNIVFIINGRGRGVVIVVIIWIIVVFGVFFVWSNWGSLIVIFII